MRTLRSATAALAAALLLTACAIGAGDRSPSATNTGGPVGPELTGTLTIFAAASLRGAFDDLSEQFMQQHPGVTITPISPDGSSTLATQIIEGAPADVFASADEKNMQKVVDAGLAADPKVFATNVLTLVTPAGNPGHVRELEDLGDRELTIVLCAAEVPCGAASATLLADVGITPSVDSYEQNVTAVLTKVASGEADAGLVYVTDAATTDKVQTIETAGTADVVNRYPIVALSGASDPALAAAFVDYVLSDTGRDVLAGRKFGLP